MISCRCSGEAPPKAAAETQENDSKSGRMDELSEQELSAYGVKAKDSSTQKKNSAFWSSTAMRILTDRQPQEAFFADDDDTF